MTTINKDLSMPVSTDPLSAQDTLDILHMFRIQRGKRFFWANIDSNGAMSRIATSTSALTDIGWPKRTLPRVMSALPHHSSTRSSRGSTMAARRSKKIAPSSESGSPEQRT